MSNPISPADTPDSTVRRTLDALAKRLTGLPSWFILTELFIGFGWLRAAAEKVPDPSWWTGDVIVDFVVGNDDAALAWYAPFLEQFVIPAAPLVAVLVVVGQLVAGLSLSLGRKRTVGLAIGMFLNLHFMASGAVTPSAFYLLAQGSLALSMAENTLTRSTIKRLLAVVVCATGLVVVNLPFISTLDPHEVIEDPAMMFAFGGSLTVLACLLTVRSHAQPPASLPSESPRSNEPAVTLSKP